MNPALAQILRYKPPVVATSPPTQWDGSTNANFTVTGSGLIATTNSGGFQTLRSIANHSTGSYYCEFKVTQNGNFCFPGFGNASTNPTAFAGSDANSGGWVANGNVFANGSAFTVIDTFALNDILGVYFKPATKLGWFKNITAGGNWNASGTANPDTNTGGLDFGANGMTGSGPFYIVGSAGTNGDSITLNAGGSAYASGRPSTATNW